MCSSDLVIVVDGKTIRSTGKEYTHRVLQILFITGVNKNNWDKLASRQMLPLPEGILTAQTLTSAKDDNTRLLYVALTRGKKRVMLSYHLFDLALSNREKSASLYVDFLRQFPAGPCTATEPANHSGLRNPSKIGRAHV